MRSFGAGPGGSDVPDRFSRRDLHEGVSFWAHLHVVYKSDQRSTLAPSPGSEEESAGADFYFRPGEVRASASRTVVPVATSRGDFFSLVQLFWSPDAGVPKSGPLVRYGAVRSSDLLTLGRIVGTTTAAAVDTLVRSAAFDPRIQVDVSSVHRSEWADERYRVSRDVSKIVARYSRDYLAFPDSMIFESDGSPSGVEIRTVWGRGAFCTILGLPGEVIGCGAFGAITGDDPPLMRSDGSVVAREGVMSSALQVAACPGGKAKVHVLASPVEHLSTGFWALPECLKSSGSFEAVNVACGVGYGAVEWRGLHYPHAAPLWVDGNVHPERSQTRRALSSWV